MGGRNKCERRLKIIPAVVYKSVYSNIASIGLIIMDSNFYTNLSFLLTRLLFCSMKVVDKSNCVRRVSGKPLPSL